MHSGIIHYVLISMIPHILMIDDQISLPRFIAMELNTEGYQVSLSSNSTGALSIMQALNPDLIVLNWELRRRSGLDIYRQLRVANKQIPIVIITAEEDDCCLELKLEAQDWLVKPFLISDLLKAIEYHLKPKVQRLNIRCLI